MSILVFSFDTAGFISWSWCERSDIQHGVCRCVARVAAGARVENRTNWSACCRDRHCFRLTTSCRAAQLHTTVHDLGAHIKSLESKHAAALAELAAQHEAALAAATAEAIASSAVASAKVDAQSERIAALVARLINCVLCYTCYCVMSACKIYVYVSQQV